MGCGTRMLSALLLVSAAVSLNACTTISSARAPKETSIPRPFFGNTIVYTVDVEAREPMLKLERLQKKLLSEEEKKESLDKVIIRLYRDADVNRDHHITKQEAMNFFSLFVVQFEEALGPVRYK